MPEPIKLISWYSEPFRALPHYILYTSNPPIMCSVLMVSSYSLRIRRRDGIGFWGILDYDYCVFDLLRRWLCTGISEELQIARFTKSSVYHIVYCYFKIRVDKFNSFNEWIFHGYGNIFFMYLGLRYASAHCKFYLRIFFLNNSTLHSFKVFNFVPKFVFPKSFKILVFFFSL